jgi:hypothetical protein
LKQICAVIGDYYHPEQWIREALESALKPGLEDGRWKLAYASEKELPAVLNQKPDLVVLFKEDRVDPLVDPPTTWMTDEIGRMIADYVRSGGGWLGWHSGLASYVLDSPFGEVLRGVFEYHPEEHQAVRYEGFEPADPGKPVSFEIVDEHYFVIIDEQNTNVFLRSGSVDGRSIGGWHHEFGQGRVCCLTPAHRREGMMHEGVQRLLLSSAIYCLKENG